MSEDTDTSILSLSDDMIAAEFRVATHKAVHNNLVEFDFYGYVISTEDAVDTVREMDATRTYH